jgi:hypothetical protein
VLSQGEIDAFVGSLGQTNERLTGQRVGALTGVAARGAPVIGNLEALGELQHIFGDQLSAPDIGDLAAKYNQSVAGGFTGANAKGVHELIGAGLDPFKALAVSAAFNKVGQSKAIGALATYLSGGGTLAGAFAGEGVTDEPGPNGGLKRAINSVIASGRNLDTIADDEASYRGVTGRDVIGEELERLPEATRRQLDIKRQERQYEINRNLEEDRGIGEEARLDEAQVTNAISSEEAAGGIGGFSRAFLFKLTRAVWGDRVVANQLGRDVPVKVEIHNQNPAVH